MIDVYRHPVTGEPFDYEHVCRTCAHYSTRTRMKEKQVCCALAPEHDGNNFGQQREAFLACLRWTPRTTKAP